MALPRRSQKMKRRQRYLIKVMLLHKYIGPRRGGLIHEKETEWCCKKIKDAVEDKQLRISFGGIHLNGEYQNKLHFINHCPFCGVRIFVELHRVSQSDLKIITQSAIQWKMKP